MPDPALGAKQICPSCTTKFYDLGRRPAACPKCAALFDPEEALRSRRIRARAVVPDDEADEEKPAVVSEAEDGFEAEPDAAPELDAVVDEPPLLADDDETEEADPAAPPAAATGLGVDFAEEDDLEEADDDEVPFIEDEDDAFPEDEIDGLPAGGDEDR